MRRQSMELERGDNMQRKLLVLSLFVVVSLVLAGCGRELTAAEIEAEVGTARDEGAGRACLLSLVLEPNDGGYLASVPDVQGAFAEGDTVEEAIFNCIEVVKLIAVYRAERGETLGPCQVEITPDTRLRISIPVKVG